MTEALSPQLLMRLPSLENLPEVQLAAGYTMRSYQDGDSHNWESIINDSFGGMHNFVKDMAGDEHYRPERVIFVCHEGHPVGTASAWVNKDGVGYLHMVGVHSDHLGHGLGGQVSLAALYQMALEGRKSAVLQTDDFRIPAIKTYLNLGFLPEVAHESHIDRWKNVLINICRNELIERLPESFESSDE